MPSELAGRLGQALYGVGGSVKDIGGMLRQHSLDEAKSAEDIAQKQYRERMASVAEEELKIRQQEADTHRMAMEGKKTAKESASALKTFNNNLALAERTKRWIEAAGAGTFTVTPQQKEAKLSSMSTYLKNAVKDYNKIPEEDRADINLYGKLEPFQPTYTLMAQDTEYQGYLAKKKGEISTPDSQWREVMGSSGVENWEDTVQIPDISNDIQNIRDTKAVEDYLASLEGQKEVKDTTGFNVPIFGKDAKELKKEAEDKVRQKKLAEIQGARQKDTAPAVTPPVQGAAPVAPVQGTATKPAASKYVSPEEARNWLKELYTKAPQVAPGKPRQAPPVGSAGMSSPQFDVQKLEQNIQKVQGAKKAPAPIVQRAPAPVQSLDIEMPPQAPITLEQLKLLTTQSPTLYRERTNSPLDINSLWNLSTGTKY